MTKTETANRIRNRIELILDFAKAKDLRSGDNPAAWRGNLSAALPSPSQVRDVRHHPALPWKQLPDFYKSLSEQAGIGAFALRFVILTGMRTGSVLNARWHQIDFDRREWLIPKQFMKTRKDFVVPLSEEAIRVLTKVRQFQVAGVDEEMIFSIDKKSLSNMTMAAVLKRMAIKNVTVHGFRSTLRDWASDEAGYPRDVAEAAIAHQVKGKVEAAYRRGDFLEARKGLMSAWATYCTSKMIGTTALLRVV